MNFSNIVLEANDSGLPGVVNSSSENETYNITELVDIETALPYYGQYLLQYRMGYLTIHGYLSLLVCIFGFFANILNIIVLTRKNMVSPINAILTGLAVTDMLAMFFYIPYTIHNYIQAEMEEEDNNSYFWAAYILFFANFSAVIHTISVWLTVTVAMWRYIGISFPLSSKNFLSMPRAKIAISSIYVTSPIICIPIYITFAVKEITKDGKQKYTVDFSQFAEGNKVVEQIVFWMFSVIIKLVPCIALTGLSIGLILVIYKANRHRHKLTNSSDPKTHDRTTKMLLAVLVMFLITEFPSGILGLLSGILGREFFINVYKNFSETLDMLVLINSSVNFIIYYSMSQYFRKHFFDLFLVRMIRKLKSSPVTESTHTIETTETTSV